jgi:uncharacterized repeat protein (TIGR03803 family)
MVMFVSLAAAALPAISVDAQTYTPIYSFTGSNDSAVPVGTPAQGRDGRLWGTTLGSSDLSGTAFALTTTGRESQIYSFGYEDSMLFSGPALVLGTDGNYYGTTAAGGANGLGVLFRLSSAGVYTDLHDFEGGSDGAYPSSAPVQASDLNLYGTTYGTSGSTVYRYETNGTYTTILNLTPEQGEYVSAPLIQGSDGKLYGTAPVNAEGFTNCGSIFKITTSGEVLWTYSFPCGKGGAGPEGPLLQASDGNFYGTTSAGGSTNSWGTIFRLTQNGKVSILYAFPNNTLEGGRPLTGLTQGTDGNLYGATLEGGGQNESGILFQMTLSGTYTVLHRFGSGGATPSSGVLQDTNGTFYGTTYAGGRYGDGTVYSLNMGLGQFTTFVQPTAAVGGTAQILGQGLTGTTSVTFNGLAATSFTVITDTYMTAVVPSGATTGKVVVTTPGGALTSNVNFRIIN